jgi:anti-anti-sigma factor
MATTILLESKKIPLGHKNHLVLVSFSDVTMTYPWREVSAVMMAETNDKTRGMLINLNQVQHLDSRGLGLLAMMAVNLEKKNISLAIVGLSQTAQQLFHASRLDHIARFFPTTEEAVRHFEMQIFS